MTTRVNSAGQVVDLTPAEQAAFDASLAAHAAGALDRAKAARKGEFQQDADARVAAIYGESDPLRLLMVQVRALAGAMQRVRAESRGGQVDPVLDALEAQLASSENIRAAAAAAALEVDAALDVAAVAAVPGVRERLP